MKTLLVIFIIWILLAASFAFASIGNIGVNVIEMQSGFGYMGPNHLIIIDGG